MHYLERYPELKEYSGRRLLNQLISRKFKGKHRHKKIEVWWVKYCRARRRHTWRLSEQQNHRCCYCSKQTWIYDGSKLHSDWKYLPDKLPHMNNADMATIDHIVPLSLGGSDKFDNWVIACVKCNHKRQAMDASEFWKLRQSMPQIQLLYFNARKRRRLKSLTKGPGNEHKQRKRAEFAVWLAYLATISVHFKMYFEFCLPLVDTLFIEYNVLSYELQQYNQIIDKNVETVT